MVTVAGAGAKDGTTWANAMGFAEFETDVEASVEAGDRYFLEEGTYTLTSSLTTLTDGITTAPIQMIGVKSGTTNEPPVFSDYPTGDNRPLFACAANAFDFDNLWQWRNLRWTITTSRGVDVDIGHQFENCKSTNSSGTGNRSAFSVVASCHYILCEAISDLGNAFSTGANNRYMGCYVHDSVTGFLMAGSSDNQLIYNCVIDTCTTGLSIANAGIGNMILSNTIYNCITAMDLGTGCDYEMIVNNIFDANTTGVDFADANRTYILDYNVYDNGTDVVNVIKGGNSVTGDPLMQDPANGFFTLKSGSPALRVGLCPDEDVGTATPCDWNIGQSQNDAETFTYGFTN